MQMTLLLDAHYQPIDLIGWQKAITLLLQEKAEVVEDGEDTVSSVSLTLNIPKVLRLIRRGYAKYRASFSKRSIFLRDKGVCAYCSMKMNLKTTTIDHVVPRCQGGTHNWLNVVTCCQKCNNKKAGRTPEQAHMTLLYKPRVPSRLDLIKQLIEESGIGFLKF